MKEKFYRFEDVNWVPIAFQNICKGDIISRESSPNFYFECIEPIHFNEEMNCDCIIVDYIIDTDNKFQVIKDE